MISPVVWALLAALSVDPNPQLGPADVVKIVADALRDSGHPSPNAGVYTAYRFASPGNHKITGPYGNFFRLVKLPENDPLRHAVQEDFDPLRLVGNAADQVVHAKTADGKTAAFRFSLSRQTDGACRGCWMIDAVGREPDR